MLTRMISVAAFTVALAVCAAHAQSSPPAGAGKKSAAKTIEGAIKGFECGDNCYLTITVAPGRDEDGLCEAKACVPWFENQAMPKSFEGKRVRVTTSVGVQRDDSGKVMGKMTTFKTLEFLK